MASPDERLMEWLRATHAMEEQAERMLNTTTHRLRDYPALRQKFIRHLEDTRRHSVAVRGCIERRDGSISFIRDLVGKTTAVAQGLGGLFVSNEVVRALVATYTCEQMAIASYQVLIAAADQVGDDETKQACEAILAEKKAMAEWVSQQLAPTVNEYLSRQQPKAA